MKRGELPSYLLALAIAGHAGAQVPCEARPVLANTTTPRFVTNDLARPAADRALARDAVGCAAGRVGSGLDLRLPFALVHVGGFSPALRFSALGGVADPRDNGVMWGGRGTTWLATAGVSLDAGRVHAVFAPVMWASENRGFRYFSSRDSSRSGFASPWYDGARSLDMPTQFGMSALRSSELGESAWWISLSRVDLGASASTQTWGPGLRAHLLLGPDAPGIPRFFARTSRDINTPIGALSATSFIGILRESPYFDRDLSNNRRRLVAMNAELTPNDVLQVSVSHAVMWAGSGYDNMTTIAVRATSPEDLGSVWVEIGRQGAPPSLRSLVTTPSANLAYVIGFAKAARVGNGGKLFLSAEMVNLEQPPAVEGDFTQDFYTSRHVPQGWTNRGRLLGAPTGPGSQSQFLALDFIPRRWSLGVFGERVRWNEDALLREYLAYPNRHDTSLRWGVRTGVAVLGYELDVAASLGKRLNYQFQNGIYIPAIHTLDLAIPQLRVTLGRPSR